jgi:hypothetical protein
VGDFLKLAQSALAMQPRVQARPPIADAARPAEIRAAT